MSDTDSKPLFRLRVNRQLTNTPRSVDVDGFLECSKGTGDSILNQIGRKFDGKINGKAARMVLSA